MIWGKPPPPPASCKLMIVALPGHDISVSWTWTHDVQDHSRKISAAHKGHGLLPQGKARAGSGRHGTMTRGHGTGNHVECRHLSLRLNEGNILLRTGEHCLCKILCHLAGRRDWIAEKSLQPARMADSAIAMLPLHECFFTHSLHLIFLIYRDSSIRAHSGTGPACDAAISHHRWEIAALIDRRSFARTFFGAEVDANPHSLHLSKSIPYNPMISPSSRNPSGEAVLTPRL